MAGQDRAHLERRRAEGRVCDGHGDLHARNLCLVDGVIRAYDCLEFEPAYRCADVAMEVAFLAMDLDRLGHRELADSFVGAYVEASGDAGLIEPSRFFRLHYAIVRAMVEAIRLSEPETPDEERNAIRDAVRSYAALAAGYAIEPATILMMGLPATGKSTLAAAMARPLRANVLRSDSVRKTLFGLRPPSAEARRSTAPKPQAAPTNRLPPQRSRCAGRSSSTLRICGPKSGPVRSKRLMCAVVHGCWWNSPSRKRSLPIGSSGERRILPTSPTLRSTWSVASPPCARSRRRSQVIVGSASTATWTRSM